jgi:hypothetical protein
VFSVIAGIVLVIVAVILWLGHITTDHALAILIGVIGVLIILSGFVPGHYFRRD